MDNEVAILKAAIANIIDHIHGSTYDAMKGSPHREKLIAHFAKEFQVSEAMATVMIDASIETSANCAFDII